MYSLLVIPPTPPKLDAAYQIWYYENCDGIILVCASVAPSQSPSPSTTLGGYTIQLNKEKNTAMIIDMKLNAIDTVLRSVKRCQHTNDMGWSKTWNNKKQYIYFCAYYYLFWCY